MAILAATLGQNLQFFDGTVSNDTTFGTTTSFGHREHRWTVDQRDAFQSERCGPGAVTRCFTGPCPTAEA